jgi:hypothetical protein
MDKLEFKITLENLKNLIKSLASLQGLTFVKLKEIINQKYNKIDSSRNLIKKLDTKTIRLDEFIEIAETFGYEVIIREK